MLIEQLVVIRSPLFFQANSLSTIAFQIYGKWSEEHSLELYEIEQYWKACIELILVLKEDTISSLMLMIKDEDPI